MAYTDSADYGDVIPEGDLGDIIPESDFAPPEQRAAPGDVIPESNLGPLIDPKDLGELESSEAGAAIRGAAREVLPGVAGGMAGLAAAGPGAAWGAGIGVPAGPLGMGIGAIVGGAGAALLAGIPASMATKYVQEKGLEAAGLREGEGFFSEAQQRADVAKHPYWTKAGELIGGAAPTFGTGGLRPLIAERVFGGGLQGGLGAAQEAYQTGHVDPANLAMDVASGALFAKPRAWTERFVAPPHLRPGEPPPGEGPPPEPPPAQDPYANAPISDEFVLSEPAAPPPAAAAPVPPEKPARNWAMATPEEDARISKAIAARDRYPENGPIYQHWNKYIEELRSTLSGKGNPESPAEASQGPGAAEKPFTPRQSDAANDATTVAAGVATEHPPAVRDEGAGNPTGAPMEARTAAGPNSPRRNLAKDAAPEPEGVVTQESTKVSESPVHEDVAAAMAADEAPTKYGAKLEQEFPTIAKPGEEPKPFTPQQTGEPPITSWDEAGRIARENRGRPAEGMPPERSRQEIEDNARAVQAAERARQMRGVDMSARAADMSRPPAAPQAPAATPKGVPQTRPEPVTPRPNAPGDQVRAEIERLKAENARLRTEQPPAVQAAVEGRQPLTLRMPGPGEPQYSMKAVDKNGKVVAIIDTHKTVDPDGRVIAHIDDITTPALSGMEPGPARDRLIAQVRNTIGPAAIRDLQRQYLKLNPDVQGFSGVRVSGARNAGRFSDESGMPHVTVPVPKPRPPAAQAAAEGRRPAPVEAKPKLPSVEQMRDAGLTESEMRNLARDPDPVKIRKINEGYKWYGGEFKKITPEDLAQSKASAQRAADEYTRDKAIFDEAFARTPYPQEVGRILGSDWGAGYPYRTGSEAELAKHWKDNAYSSLQRRLTSALSGVRELERVLARGGAHEPRAGEKIEETAELGRQATVKEMEAAAKKATPEEVAAEYMETVGSGNHKDALELMRLELKEDPSLATDRVFQDARKIIQRAAEAKPPRAEWTPKPPETGPVEITKQRGSAPAAEGPVSIGKGRDVTAPVTRAEPARRAETTAESVEIGREARPAGTTEAMQLKVIGEMMTKMKEKGIDPATVTSKSDWQKGNLLERAKLATRALHSLVSKTGEATGAGDREVRIPKKRATTATGKTVSSPARAALIDRMNAVYDRLMSEFPMPKAEETVKETLARAQKIRERFAELSKGEKYRAPDDTPGFELLKAANALKRSPGTKGVEEFRSTELQINKGETKQVRETRRIQSDIELNRRTVPETVAETQVAKKQEGEQQGRIQHRTFENNEREHASDTRHRNAASEWLNGLSDEAYNHLNTLHEGQLDTDLVNSKRPVDLYGVWRKELSDWLNKKNAKLAEMEAAPAESMPTVKEEPVRTAKDVAKAAEEAPMAPTGKSLKGTPEFEKAKAEALARMQGVTMHKRGSKEAEAAATKARAKLDERLLSETARLVEGAEDVGPRADKASDYFGDKPKNPVVAGELKDAGIDKPSVLDGLRNLIADENGALTIPKFAFSMPGWMKSKQPGPAATATVTPPKAPFALNIKPPKTPWKIPGLEKLKAKADAFWYPERGPPEAIYASELGNHEFGRMNNLVANRDGKLRNNSLDAIKTAKANKMNAFDWGGIFRAMQAGDLSQLKPHENDIVNNNLKPLQKDNDSLYTKTRDLMIKHGFKTKEELPEVVPVVGNGLNEYMPRLRKGKQHWDHADDVDLFIGGKQNIDPNSAAMEMRDFFALHNNRTGERVVIVPGKDQFTILRNGAPQKVILPKNSKFNPSKINDVINLKVKGKADDWIVNHAGIDEIKLANGKDTNGNWKVEYYDNPLLALTDRNSMLGKSYERMRLYDDIVSNPQFQKMVRHGMSEEEARRLGYSKPKLTQFKDVWLPNKVAWTMDDFARRGILLGDGASQAAKDYAERISAALAKNIVVWAPLMQGMNIFTDWMIGRGARWFNPMAYKTLGKDTIRAIEAVSKQDSLVKEIIDAGGNLMKMQSVTRQMMPLLAKKLGIDVQSKPARWDVLAKPFNIDTRAMLNRFYDRVSDPIWHASDVMAIQRYIEEKRVLENSKMWKEGPKLKQEATRLLNEAMAQAPDPVREAELLATKKAVDWQFSPENLNRMAVRKMHEFVDSYRMPTTFAEGVLGENAGRFAQKVLSDPTLSMFAPYHYGRFRAMGAMLRNMTKPDATYQERLQAAGQAMMLTMSLAVLYPALSKAYSALTGDEHSRVEPRGTARVVDIMKDVITGDRDLGELHRNVLMTQSVPLTMFEELMANKNWQGKEIVGRTQLYKGDKLGRAVGQLGEYALQSTVPPYKVGSAAAEEPGATAGTIGRKVLEQLVIGGGTTPSPAAIRYEANKDKLRGKAELQREKRPRGVVERATNWLTRAYEEGGPVTATATRGVIPTIDDR